MKKKVISALILIAIAIPVIIIGGIPLKVLICLIAMCGYKEIVDLKKGPNKYPMVVVLIGLCNLLNIIISGFLSQKNALSINSFSLGLTILSMVVPVIIVNNNDKYSSTDALSLVGAILVLGISFSTMYMIGDYDILYLVYLLLITVSNDTFAQYGGKYFGKHKLTKISPKKTWEGSIIGALLGTLVAVVFYLLTINNCNIFVIISLTLLFSVLGQLGDLFFSAIKRLNNIKDFSNLIPGHGGILDRFDSLIFVLLAFAMFIAYI